MIWTTKLRLFLILLISTIVASKAFAMEISTVSDYLHPQETKTISMDFKSAQLNDVLKIFSQQSGMNFIASNEIAGKTINLYLENVPIEAALERILSANNLTYEIDPDSNIFVVKQRSQEDRQLITRVYELRHASVSSSKLLSTLDIEEGSSSSGTESTDSEEGATSSGSSSGFISAIQTLLSSDGTLTEDPRTNSLIITDYPSQFPLIEQTIARLDIRIPQILIEVEMLDISKSSADILGAKFSQTPFTFRGAKKDVFYPFNQGNILDGTNVGEDTGVIDIEDQYTAGSISFSTLTIALDFLKAQTDTKNLARPRILTLNNETAEIEIITDEVIGLNSTISQEGSSTVEEAERSDTGVYLRVTPQANVYTREITMALEPRVTQARTSSFSSLTTDYKDPEQRGTKSILRVMDGDTVIMGGLLLTDVSDERRSLPFFGDLPIVGRAFRHKDKLERERELIIFITPHIMQEDLAFNKRPSPQRIVREQNRPSQKQNDIDKELSFMEKNRY